MAGRVLTVPAGHCGKYPAASIKGLFGSGQWGLGGSSLLGQAASPLLPPPGLRRTELLCRSIRGSFAISLPARHLWKLSPAESFFSPSPACGFICLSVFPGLHRRTSYLYMYIFCLVLLLNTNTS